MTGIQFFCGENLCRLKYLGFGLVKVADWCEARLYGDALEKFGKEPKIVTNDYGL